MECRYFLLIIILLSSNIFFNTSISTKIIHSPIGYWRTLDNEGKPKQIIQISKTTEKNFLGKVIKILANKHSENKMVCSKCAGHDHNKPVEGMVIMQGSNTQHCNIFEPQKGVSYPCVFKLSENGQVIHIHRYNVLLPFNLLYLLTPMETWERVDLMAG